MYKKILTAAAAVPALVSSVLAAGPTVLTDTVYEKAANISLLDVTEGGSNMTAVYAVLGALLVFVVLFWFLERKNRRALRQAQEFLSGRQHQDE